MRQFGTVRKLPSGRFQCRYWHLGEQVAAPTTFTTKADANAWLAAVETDIRRGEHVDPRPGAERFSAYAQQWLDERGLKPRTRETYDSQRKWILSSFGDVRLSDITPPTVRSWYGELGRRRGCATGS